MVQRCINLDWFEVFCNEIETQPKDAKFFASQGWEVKEREYGTPQYKEMFTLYDNGYPFIEIRRNPYSLKKMGGIFEPTACHLRLSNFACYAISPIDDLRKFILAYEYKLKAISRVDICLDFDNFDKGDDPQRIIQRYMRNELSKINQCNVSAHGRDQWDGRNWNSLAWGAKKSMISTKIYNKQMELNQTHDKPYIRKQWVDAGLISNIKDKEKNIWRVEFSIKTEAKKWVIIKDESRVKPKEIAMPSTLSTYDNREKLMCLFYSLSTHYFHFKHVEKDENGNLKRKDRCKDKVLFTNNTNFCIYQAKRLERRAISTRVDKMLINRCKQIHDDTSLELSIRYAAEEIEHVLINQLFDKRRESQNKLTNNQYDFPEPYNKYLERLDKIFIDVM